MILIYGTDVIIFVNSVPDCILHTDFLPLIDKRNSTEKNTDCSEHLSTCGILGIVRKKTRHTSWFIMIFDDICFQTTVLNSKLGVGDRFTPFFEVYRWCIIPSMFSVTEYMCTKVKNCGKMTIFTDKCIKFALFHIKYFAYSKCFVFLECMFLQIFKKFSDTIYFVYHFPTAGKSIRTIRFEIRKVQILLDVNDCINTESGKSFFKPPVDHFIKFFSQKRVFPVKIGLFFGKHVQVVFISTRYRFPAASAKVRTQVTWGITVSALAEIEIISIFSVGIGQGFLEPFVLVRTVIDDQIHNNIHIPFLRFGKQFVKLFHRSEFFRNCVVIRNIIALIYKR